MYVNCIPLGDVGLFQSVVLLYVVLRCALCCNGVGRVDDGFRIFSASPIIFD